MSLGGIAPPIIVMVGLQRDPVRFCPHSTLGALSATRNIQHVYHHPGSVPPPRNIEHVHHHPGSVPLPRNIQHVYHHPGSVPPPGNIQRVYHHPGSSAHEGSARVQTRRHKNTVLSSECKQHITCAASDAVLLP